MGQGQHLLDERLSLLLEMAPRCRGAADIGTDHGLLICALVESGKAGRGIACDLNAMPLQKAREEIARRGLTERIRTLQTDGLTGLGPDDFELAVIAGMGGELIAKILSDWPHVKSPGITYLLQPMTRPEHLRGWLWREGFSIGPERCCRAAGHDYCAMLARYTGHVFIPEPWQLYAGAVDPADNAGQRYLAAVALRLLHIAGAREAARGPDPETARLRAAGLAITKMLREAAL